MISCAADINSRSFYEWGPHAFEYTEQGPEFVDAAIGAIGEAISKQEVNPYQPSYRHSHVHHRLMEFFGLSASTGDDVMQAWASFDRTRGPKVNRKFGADLTPDENAHELAAIFTRNLREMHALDQADRQAVTTLRNTYGIRHFGRYATKTLQRQLATADTKAATTSSPRSVVISGLRDWNNGLPTVPGQRMDGFTDETTVYMEAADGIELRQRLSMAARLHGKTGTLILNAHASPVFLGLNSKRESVGTSEFIGLVEDNSLSPEAEIIILGCRAGKWKRLGIARVLAEATGLPVYASPTYTSGMRQEENGVMNFVSHIGANKRPNVFMPSSQRMALAPA